MAESEQHPPGTAAFLERVALALPVLLNLLNIIGLRGGARITVEMLDDCRRLRSERKDTNV